MRTAIGKPVARIATEATRRMQMLKRSEQHPNATVRVLGALGAGAVLMYFLDPNRGKRRRRLLADKIVHAGHSVGNTAGKTARHLRNRVTGVVSVARQSRMREAVDDRVLVERARAELGRVVSHPGAIQVTAQDGIVALAGPVLRSEVDALLRRVQKVRGVSNVEDLLEVHDSAEGIAALQGGPPSPDVAQVGTPAETGVPPRDAAALH